MAKLWAAAFLRPREEADAVGTVERCLACEADAVGALEGSRFGSYKTDSSNLSRRVDDHKSP